ncbi:MAG: hypothetical protein ACOYBY_01710 [Dermatophilaceae bacterium]
MKRSIASAWLLLALVALLTTACTQPDQPAPPPSLLSQILPDYNVRNNAAIAASHRYDPSLWKTADTAALLDGDLFETRAREALAVPAQPGQLILDPVQQFGDPPASYPKWVVGAVTQRQDPPPSATAQATPTADTTSDAGSTPSSSPGAQPDIEVAVFEQAADGAPWLMSQNVPVDRADLPQDGAGAPATAAQQQAATQLGYQLAEFLTSGQPPAGVQLRSAAELRATSVESTEDISRTLGCALYSPSSSQSGVSEAVRVARAGSVSLMAISLSCVTTSTSLTPNSRMTWKPGWDKLYQTRPGDKDLRQPWAAMMLVAQPDGGEPAVIGADRRNVL